MLRSQPCCTSSQENASFVWDEVHQVAFDSIKEKLVNAPILTYPSPDNDFILDTDASGTAIGAVLSQIQDGEERVVCYGSFVLTPEQRKYCVTRRELLAVVRFTRQFRHYLLGPRFLLRTDHNSLTWLLRFKYIEGQLARWLEELSQFDMTILHRSGSKHGNADGLSRIPDNEIFCDCYRAGMELESLPCKGCSFCTRAHQQWSRFEDDVDEVVPLAVRSVSVQPESWIPGYTKEQLSELQLQDPTTQKLISWISTDIEPKQKDLAICGPAVKYFYLNREQLVYRNGLLFYLWKDSTRDRLLLIVPESLKQEIMSLSHDLPLTGHMGIAKTLLRIRMNYVWYRMAKDVELFVKSCNICNRNKKANIKAKAGLGQYHAGIPMEHVHIDILGPFTPSDKGNQYVLMIVDQFTKWLECFPLPCQSAEETAKCVVNGFISRLGCPIEIHTDQGRNFDGNLFASVCEFLQISKCRTTPYRPCSNGQVERYNRTLLQLIRCFLRSNQKSWDEHLQQLAGAIRSTINRTTGFTPNLMMLGREILVPVNLMIGESETQDRMFPAEYVNKLQHIMKQVHTLARENLLSSQMRQKRDYDVKLKVVSYEVGDLVYVIDSAKTVGVSPKLQPVWKGPYVISRVISPILFVVAGRNKTFVLHHDRLKPCGDRDVPFWLRRKRNNILNGAEIEGVDHLFPGEDLELDRLFEEHVESPTMQPDNLEQYITEENLDFEFTIAPGDEESSIQPDSQHLLPTRYGRERRRPNYLQDYCS